MFLFQKGLPVHLEQVLYTLEKKVTINKLFSYIQAEARAMPFAWNLILEQTLREKKRRVHLSEEFHAYITPPVINGLRLYLI